MERRTSAPIRRGGERPLAIGAILCVALLLAGSGCDSGPSGAPDSTGSFDDALFRDPPRALAPRARVWWPGGAVDDAIVDEQLTRLADAGYGGVELQTLTLGLSPAEISADDRILTVGTAGFLQRVRHFAGKARALGLEWDLTLGSGWPNGVPGIGREAERQLLLATATVVGPQRVTGPLPRPGEPDWVSLVNGILPALGPFDENLEPVAVLAARVVDGAADPPILGEVTEIGAFVDGDRIDWPAPAGEHRILALYANRVSHFVLGHAFPGDPRSALVVDHLDPSGLAAVLAAQGDPWLDALDGALPDSIFIDSFELVAELPWTPSFAENFRASTGYSIVPHLPFLFRRGGEAKYAEILRTADVPAWASDDPAAGIRAREDYEQVRDELFRRSFVDPARAWAERRGVELRLQAHGGYADVLDTYAAAHVPESEGLYGGGSFDFLALAASAAHVAGRRDVSSESFVLTHLNGTDPLQVDEFWLLAGRAFAAGITRLVHHGVAYPYERANGQPWYPFRPGDGAITAGPLPITTEFRPGTERFGFLPGFNAAQARIAYAMSLGEHRADVAWLLPDRQFRDVATLINAPVVPEGGESPLSLALRRAGYVYDRVSRARLAGATVEDGALAVGHARYRALLISDLEAAEPELLRAVETAADAGIPVVVVGGLPRRATGLRDRESRDASVAASVARLRGRVVPVGAPADVAPALLAARVRPALSVGDAGPTLSIGHRDLGDEHLFFLFNESYEARTWHVGVGIPATRARLFDPEDGEGRAVELVETDGGPGFDLTLPAARGRILHLGR